MNTLLIYNNNISTSLATNFEGETYFFQIGKAELLNTNFSIDAKIHSVITSQIEKKKYDAIFIPFSLSEDNYIEFIGLRFAFHIRLTKEFGNIQTPIIFYGAENATEVNKLSNIGSILFSRNVFMTDKISVLDFKKQVDWVKENYFEIDETDFQNAFTSRNPIIPSGNYATHHSITNEWCIYRWAKALKIEDDSIKKIENIINSNLYFKYLQAKYPILEVHEKEDQISLKDGKVLFIDDEIKKGWGIIFKKICQPKSIEVFGSDFKNKTSKEIIDESVAEVKKLNPDVVVLDFRLHDDDFETNNPQNVTSYEILKKIKTHNQGIQVIILSATNKIWNLLELQKVGADGFILKESPELSIDANFTKKSIDHIYKVIEEAIPKARFLKEIIFKGQLLKNSRLNFKNTDNEKIKKFKSNSKERFRIAELLLINDNQNSIDYVLLNYILIIEDYCNLFTIYDKKYHKLKPRLTIFDTVNNLVNRTNELVVFETIGEKIISKFKYVKGFYPFQKNKNEEKDKQFINYQFENVEYDKDTLEVSLALKLAAILNYQISDMSELEHLMKCIFIRNNKIVHTGQNFDSKQIPIFREDVLRVFNLINNLLNTSF